MFRFLLILFVIGFPNFFGIATAQTAADFSSPGGGSIILGADAEACDGAKEGALRYNGASNCAEYCDGSAWECPNSGGSTTNIFGFPPITNVAVGSIEISAILRATLASSLAVSVSGDGSPEYRLCGTSDCSTVNHTWSSSAGSIDDGEYLQLRMTSNAAVSTENKATLTVGSDSVEWSVTTTSTILRRVFVTQAISNGNHGGVAGADATCQSEAATAGLPGTYKAWISDDTSTPNNSFTKYGADYVLTDGTVIANGWTDLTDGTIDNAINVYANSVSYTTGITAVMTNTNTSGNAVSASNTCSNFTIGFGSVNIGLLSDTNSFWTLRTNNSCGNSARLYCFQQ